MKDRIVAPLLGFALLCGCGHKEAKTAEDLKAAFEKQASSAAITNTAPEIRTWVDQAVTAMKNDDQTTAVMSLRSNGQLTVEQNLTVEHLMIKARASLVERAAKGDQKAQAALQMLNMNSPR